MPYKHQAESYRVIDGQRFESWGDFPEQEALTEKIQLINAGWKVRLFKMGDGMTRIFRFKLGATT